MSIVYVSNDLMFSSRLSAAAQAAAVDVRVAGDVSVVPSLLEDGAVRLVVLDLTLPGLDPSAIVPVIRAAAPDAAVIAYGPHVHEQKLAAAQAAGCSEVLSKGQFNSNLGQLIARYATPA